MKHCPHCMRTLRHLEAAFASKEPEPGDVIFCSDCLSFSIITEKMELRKPDEKEERMIYRDPRCLGILDSASHKREN